MEYLPPKQFLQFPEVNNVFRHAQDIGNFASIYSHKFHVIDTERGKIIEKESFLKFVRYVNAYENPSIVLP